MEGISVFAVVVLCGLAQLSLGQTDCDEVAIDVWCLNDTIVANCSCSGNLSLAVEDGGWSNCSCEVTRDLGGSENHEYHRSSINFGSAPHSVVIPWRPDEQLTTNLGLTPRGLAIPTVMNLQADQQIVGFGSDILVVEVFDEEGILVTSFADDPVLLNFTIDAYDPEEETPLCCFQLDSDVWSDEGCSVSSETVYSVTCSCDHLTSFAILMQTKKVLLNDTDKRVLEILTKIGLSLSIACLVLTLLVYALCRLRSLRIVIHANLAFALLVAHTVFLFIQMPGEGTAGCATVAVFLHFFLLAAFSWMALEGVFLLIKSTPTFQTRIRLPAWLVVGWGFPTVIVLISMASRFAGYVNNQNCWLSFENGFVWSFITPVLVIMIFNTVVLIRLIVIFMSLHKNKQKSEAQKMKAGLRLVLILAPLLGLPWITGLLYSNPHTTFFAYVFVISNSLQGVFLLVTQCILDEEVRQKLKLFKSKRSSKVISLTSTSNAQSKSSKESMVSSRSCKRGGSQTHQSVGESRNAEFTRPKPVTDTRTNHVNKQKEASEPGDCPEKRPCTPEAILRDTKEPREPQVVKECFVEPRGGSQLSMLKRPGLREKAKPTKIWRY